MADCPFCGEKMKDENAGCTKCGYNFKGDKQEIYGEAREIESRVIEEQNEKQQGDTGDGKVIPMWVKAIFVALTIFGDYWIGAICGVIFIASKKRSLKDFGKTLLIIAFAVAAIQWIFFAMATSIIING